MACSQLHSCTAARHVALLGLDRGELPLGQGRLLLGRAHVHPDHAAALAERIGLELDLLAEAALRGFRGHLNALAVHVVLPAVVRAADAVLLVAAEVERHATVRAELVDEAQLPGGVAEGDHALAHALDAHGRAVVFRQLPRQQDGQPVAAEELAHGRARPGAGEEFVLFGFHENPSGKVRNPLHITFSYTERRSFLWFPL
jgi:hypothetical protein